MSVKFHRSHLSFVPPLLFLVIVLTFCNSFPKFLYRKSWPVYKTVKIKSISLNQRWKRNWIIKTAYHKKYTLGLKDVMAQPVWPEEDLESFIEDLLNKNLFNFKQNPCYSYSESYYIFKLAWCPKDLLWQSFRNQL